MPSPKRALEHGFDWPPLIRVDDTGARIRVTVRAALVRDLEALLLFSPSKKERKELAEAFEDLLLNPPSGVGAKTAKSWLVKVSITAVIRSAGQRWKGRIGSGRWVEGVPAAASGDRIQCMGETRSLETGADEVAHVQKTEV